MLPIASIDRNNRPTRELPRLIAMIVLLSVAALAALPQLASKVHAAGNTYYVAATNSSDSNPGTIGLPWKTIQKATRSVAPGDTVLIRGGVYYVRNTDEMIRPPSGTADHFITFKAYSGETATIQGNYGFDWKGISIEGRSYIQIEGLKIRGFHIGISCQAPGHHIVIKNNTLEYNSEAGILSSGAASGSLLSCDYMTIEGNRIHDNGYYDTGQPATGTQEGWSSGISIHPQYTPYRYNSDSTKFHTTISRNTIYHNYDGTGGDSDNQADHTEGHGIILDTGGANMPPTLIENNVIFDNGGKCITSLGTQNIWIVGNTCYWNSTDPLWKDPEAKSEIAAYPAVDTDSGQLVPVRNFHVLNNIAYALEGQRITDFPDTNFAELDMRNNLWFGQPPHDPYACPYGQAPICGDPLFVNPSTDPQTADFRIRAQSPAIDAGTSQLAWPNMQLIMQLIDFAGTSRPQRAGYDIGAYESTAAVEPPPVVTVRSLVWLPYVVSSGVGGTCQY
jgi:hypothetical protein